MNDFESAMYELLTAALIVREACLFDSGEIPDHLSPIMEALDEVEIAAPTVMMEASNRIRETVADVLGRGE